MVLLSVFIGAEGTEGCEERAKKERRINHTLPKENKTTLEHVWTYPWQQKFNIETTFNPPS